MIKLKTKEEFDNLSKILFERMKNNEKMILRMRMNYLSKQRYYKTILPEIKKIKSLSL